MSQPSNPFAIAKEAQAKERSARISHGLPPDHILDFADFPFRFAHAEVKQWELTSRKLLELNPGSDLVVGFRVQALVALKEYQQANLLMDRYRELAPDKPQAVMQFGLAPKPSHIELPAVKGDFPSRPSFFFACDADYLDYLIPLLRSFAHQAPHAPVHVHLMSRQTEKLADVRALALDISVTSEDPQSFISALKIEPRNYYGAARFIRFAEALERNAGPLWMSDVDGILTADPRPLLSLQTDAAMRVRPGRIEPWHQFSACLVMGSATSRPYFRRVADILKADLHRAWWGFDQLALFSAAIGVPSTIGLLGPDIAAVDQDPGLFWFTAGKKKADLLTDSSPYSIAYRRYL